MRKTTKNLLGVASLFVLFPVALASVSLGVGAKIVNRSWTQFQRSLYENLGRPVCTSRPRSTASTTASEVSTFCNGNTLRLKCEKCGGNCQPRLR